MADVTEQNYPEFKKMYLAAVKAGKEQFNFEGQLVLTSYAKYLCEYFETRRHT